MPINKDDLNLIKHIRENAPFFSRDSVGSLSPPPSSTSSSLPSPRKNEEDEMASIDDFIRDHFIELDSFVQDLTPLIKNSTYTLALYKPTKTNSKTINPHDVIHAFNLLKTEYRKVLTHYLESIGMKRTDGIINQMIEESSSADDRLMNTALALIAKIKRPEHLNHFKELLATLISANKIKTDNYTDENSPLIKAYIKAACSKKRKPRLFKS